MASSSLSSSPSVGGGLVASVAVLAATALQLNFVVPVEAGSSSNRYDSSNYGMYQQSGKSTWLNSGSTSFQIKGCVWAVTEANEEFGCLEDSSEDGTYSWYQMANCRRAQVAYNVYASNSGSTQCKSSNFKEAFHSEDGVVGFFQTISNYYGSNYYVSYNDVYNLPSCSWSDSAGAYVDVGCGNDGSFVLAKFNDKYCLSPSGSVYNNLNSLNNKIKKMSNKCVPGDDVLEELLQYSESCSPLDNALCGDEDGSKVSTYQENAKRRYSSSSASTSSTTSKKLQSFANTVKYALGSCFLLASFIMFLGILMMNRRKRRANLNRKFRQSATSSSGKKKRRHRSSSRSSRHSSRSRSASGRSKSRERPQVEDGVYT